ncbi:MAG TPA: T9SS type A sorting domain-containing protein, partial [Rhodothermales bacterium]|nr:T9SS type A sorting domain-containing protein [Rhodothermales bacterium]
GGDLRIDRNDALANVAGLSAVGTIGGNLRVTDNDTLTNVDGLRTVTTVGGSLTVRDNDALTACSCGLYSCVQGNCVDNSITLRQNDANGDCNADGADLLPNACPAVGIEDEARDSELPSSFALHPAYPNPFNPAATIRYDLLHSGDVRLKVFDGLGRLVTSLVDSRQSAGRHSVRWETGEVPSGVYLVRMEAGRFVGTRSLVLVK